MVQPLTFALLNDFVLSKLYFDRRGLIVATDDEAPLRSSASPGRPSPALDRGPRPIGFVHAAFGPNADGSQLSTERGVICMLLVEPHPRRAEVERELLARAETYLRARGARMLYAGGLRPLDPFYLGLYGGSELPGFLDSGPLIEQVLVAEGYQPVERTLVYQAQLAAIRPVVDRTQLQIRRQMDIQAVFDPPLASWWEACVTSCIDRTRFELHLRQGGPALAAVTYWLMEAFSMSWGAYSVGMLDLEVDPSWRRRGLATFLLSESMRYLYQQGVTLVEAHTPAGDEPAVNLLRKLGYVQVDSGTMFAKQT
jgi:ribosomal protein S18 acetylase RimI-like enzyme